MGCFVSFRWCRAKGPDGLFVATIVPIALQKESEDAVSGEGSSLWVCGEWLVWDVIGGMLFDVFERAAVLLQVFGEEALGEAVAADALFGGADGSMVGAAATKVFNLSFHEGEALGEVGLGGLLQRFELLQGLGIVVLFVVFVVFVVIYRRKRCLGEEFVELECLRVDEDADAGCLSFSEGKHETLNGAFAKDFPFLFVVGYAVEEGEVFMDGAKVFCSKFVKVIETEF